MIRPLFFSQPILFVIIFLIYNKTYCNAPIQDTNTIQQVLNLPNDTVKVNKLISTADSISKSNPQTSQNLLLNASTLSEKLNYPLGIGKSNYLMSVFLYKQGNYDSAEHISNSANKNYQIIGHKIGLASSYNVLGCIYRRKGYLSTSLEYHMKSLSIFSSIHDSTGLAKTYNFIGIIHKEMAQYDSAIIYYLNQIRISEDIDFMDGYLSGLINAGQVFYELKEYRKAKNYLLKSVEINSEIKNKINLAHALNKLGMIEYYLGNEDSALNNFEKALAIYDAVNSKSGLGWVIMNMGFLFEQNKEYLKALLKYEEAKSNFMELGLISGVLKARINIAVINKKQRNFQFALKQYDTCLAIAREIDARDELLKIYDNIHKTYREMGNNDKALEYLDKYVALNDSIFNLEKAEIIADLELKYEKEKNETQILTLSNENLQKDLELKKESNRKNMYMAGGGLFFLITVFSVLYFRQRIKKNKQLAEQKLMKAEEEKKLSSAQALLEGQEEERMRVSKELHDGVGVLLSTANLYLSSVAEDETKNKELLSKAHKIVTDANLDVRKISRNLMPTVLSMSGLDDALNDLIENIDILPDKYGEFHVSGETVRLSKPREVMVYRLVQELISNTVKHAHAETVDLELEYKPAELIIIYKDDGLGFDFDKEMSKKSVGLKSIKSRIDFLKGSMTFSSKKGEGATFRISIPVEIEG
ncbi:MAG: sensor histidine kinase [Bacteroidales bacterium]|nr:sensor histidine kinase [Bacteroidales bacterium]